MTELSGKAVGSRDALAVELRAIRQEIERHNRTIRRNRLYLGGLGLTLALVTGLGVVGYVDDQNDDRRECRTDNQNSVRDSEVLIGAVEAGDPSPQTEEAIERYREDVRANLRDC